MSRKKPDKMDIEVAFLYVDDTRAHEMSFANTIYTPDGGTQLTGFRSALTRSLNNFARAEGYLKEKEENLTSEDVREGLVAIVSVKLSDPQFEGQTKNRLGNPEAQTATAVRRRRGAERIFGKASAGSEARSSRKLF